jgi:hypothetical protein
MNLDAEDLQHLISCARGKFEAEQYPFAPALRPVRDVLSKAKPKVEPRPPQKPYVPSLLMTRRKRR